ncbi:hypothetical protein DNTS_011907 [Danionella cerebrum]|uniref:Uncharacterized protein n=1 Tax=Danionella cerebrum TaxID=2873325 RepID=A0A553Q7H4_9TELE|nr:hypothetical protein DNTS_011907 [Danionella translucida]
MGTAAGKPLPPEEDHPISGETSSSPPPSLNNNTTVPHIVVTAPSRENLLGEKPSGLSIAEANKERRPTGKPVFVGRGRVIRGYAERQFLLRIYSHL